MTRPRARLPLAAVVLAGLLALLTTPAAGAALLPAAWTVSATPTTIVEGQPTDIRLTASVVLTLARIRCVAVLVPAGFTVLAASVISVPSGETWTAAYRGSSPTSVTYALSQGGGGLQLLQTGQFDIRVVATTSAVAAWTTAGYDDESCGSQDVGPPVPPLQPFVILPAPTPGATPSPSPSPTAVPTGAPTVAPGPVATPIRTPSPTPTGGATAGTASPTPSPSLQRPTPTATTAPPGGPVARVGPPGPAANGGSAAAAPLTVPAAAGGPTVTIGDLGVADTLGRFAWLVPGALLGLPGLLILLIVAGQAGLAAAFVPLTRRLMGQHEGSAPQ